LSGLFSCFLAAAAWHKQKTGQPEQRRKNKSLSLCNTFAFAPRLADFD
jgi:hypothetical protein